MSEKIALVPIHGTISRGFSFFGGSSTQQVLRVLGKIKAKKSIKALILDLDSPGGEPYPCKELADFVKKIKKTTIALIKGSATSGAYWVASACDRVIADELSIVGGIGVLGLRPDLSGLLQKLGVSIDSIASGKYKELGWPFQKPGKEEKEIIEKQVKVIHESFFGTVREKRKLNEKMLPDIKEGKIFYGKEALEAGLIDSLGGREEALELAKELAGLKKPKLVDYTDRLRPSLLKSLLGW